MFAKGTRIGAYTVSFLLRKGLTYDFYRAKDEAGLNCFLKVSKNSLTLEKEILSKVKHPNISSCADSFGFIDKGKKYEVLVYPFISGVDLNKYIIQNDICDNEARRIIQEILNGLVYLQNLSKPVVLNNLSPASIIMDLSTIPHIPKIIDLSDACYINEHHSIKNTENAAFCAPENNLGQNSLQTDVYSAGAILYTLVFHLPPFFKLGTASKDVNLHKESFLEELYLPKSQKSGINSGLLKVIYAALSNNLEERYKDAQEMLNAIINLTVSDSKVNESERQSNNIKKNKGGFADVAGMEELKAELYTDVIEVLQHPEEAKKLGLTLPNGLLFYGPPGCGKTFFAEKFAQEVGCNYMYVKCSDIASPYIHGGQGKIAELFKLARQKAPTILFFDEIDAILMDRNKHTNVSESGEVNELLAQFNNCGRDGVIVIGATNKPDMLDEAAMRAGRLEYHYYKAPPDIETRAKIFQLSLRNRETASSIDFNKLAELTENYISADIKLLVDKAARMVFRNHTKRIEQKDIEDVIKNSQPSLSKETLEKYKTFSKEFKDKKGNSQRRRIGFY